MRALILVFCAIVGSAVASPASALNLFEVQVFPDETLGRGERVVKSILGVPVGRR